MYELAYVVRPREDIVRLNEPKEDHKELNQEVDSPFDMSQLKTLVMDGEPARERANLMRIQLDQEQKAEQSGLIKSDPDVDTSCAIAAPKISEEAARKKAKRVENAIAIVSKDDYSEARLGRIPGNSARILWRPDGSIYTPPVYSRGE